MAFMTEADMNEEGGVEWREDVDSSRQNEVF
jgi:hypothetical protein